MMKDWTFVDVREKRLANFTTDHPFCFGHIVFGAIKMIGDERLVPLANQCEIVHLVLVLMSDDFATDVAAKMRTIMNDCAEWETFPPCFVGISVTRPLQSLFVECQDQVFLERNCDIGNISALAEPDSLARADHDFHWYVRVIANGSREPESHAVVCCRFEWHSRIRPFSCFGVTSVILGGFRDTSGINDGSYFLRGHFVYRRNFSHHKVLNGSCG